MGQSRRSKYTQPYNELYFFMLRKISFYIIMNKISAFRFTFIHIDGQSRAFVHIYMGDTVGYPIL
jgi:hypothetical protein